MDRKAGIEVEGDESAEKENLMTPTKPKSVKSAGSGTKRGVQGKNSTRVKKAKFNSGQAPARRSTSGEDSEEVEEGDDVGNDA